VSQAVDERGLRVTRYSPSHNAINKAIRFTVKVI